MLDDFTATLSEVRTRITKHGPQLSQNETRTRLSLVDPVLNILGWDVVDLSLVIPEYDVDRSRADYALLDYNGQPLVILEAKKLGSKLDDHLDQMLGYCISQGIKYAAMTDGNKWRLYKTFDPVPLADKLLLDIDLTNDLIYHVALKMLILWRLNISSHVPDSANVPITMDSDGDDPAATTIDDEPETTDSSSSRKVFLDSLVDVRIHAMVDGIPISVTYGDYNWRYGVKSWADLISTTARYLYNKDLLNEVNIYVIKANTSRLDRALHADPVYNRTAKHAYLNTKPLTGTPFHICPHGNANNGKQVAVDMLKACGVDLSTVYLQF